MNHAALQDTEACVVLLPLGCFFQETDPGVGILDELHHLGLGAKDIILLSALTVTTYKTHHCIYF